ncbi:hypothetical protein CGRA01v4_07393 [Colletotrichum graminicola]|uniref:DRBM domain-containing protein n=1 Tax=Colletotrichum graminicola (strain M1.001 / M2 / FGSC 10212) TaxID=645133 RepID=E3QC60_COLGM|nr:uncharacterized protein GLRG_03592 [Colletotrichum graminicola M1.001]EFQ28448.1 hypothetical protein GLRG_03592 [Colletotrichum graminicola M1.001]WDK16112.1 hypothetical protein CGRA01v4_07393 [Colletotrichum graminicola]
MSAPSLTGAPAQGVDWAALKSYIAEKERFEAENGRPAPLSEMEAEAIAVLLRPAPRLDPDLGSENWLGLLNHFQQVRSQKITFKDAPREHPRLGKAPELRWACTAAFTSTGDVFPRPGYGVDTAAGATVPDFPRKQDAKQYAAMTACKWLIDNGHMLPSGDLPKLPKAFAPVPLPAGASASPSVSVLPAKRSPPSSPPVGVDGSSTAAARKRQDNQPARASPRDSNDGETGAPDVARRPSPAKELASASASTSASSSTTTSSASTPSAGVPIAIPLPATSNSSELSATQRVRELCSRLKYPVPHYRLTQDTTVPGGDFWNGCADFSNDLRVPEDLGTVNKVLTKRAAKDRMSEHILAWLLHEQEERNRKAKRLLGGNGP